MPPPGDGKLYVTFADYGQGDCIIMCFPNGKTALIDCGTARAEDASSGTVHDTLYSDEFLGKYNKLDALILTHPDKDHYSQLTNILKPNIQIEALYHSATLPEYKMNGVGSWLGYTNKPKKVSAVTLNATTSPKTPQLVVDGRKGTGPACTLSILASNVVAQTLGLDKTPTPNNIASVVSLLVFDDLKFLLCADATRSTENFLVANFRALISKVHVLHVPHHASQQTSSQQSFIDVVDPERVVITAARDSGKQLKLPRGEVIGRYLAMKRLDDDEDHTIWFYEYEEDEEEEVTVGKRKRREQTAYYKSLDTDKNLKTTGSNGNVAFVVSP